MSEAALLAGALLCALLPAFFAAPAAHAQSAVCAEVKIEIKQKLSLERQAFDAVMRINNGLDTAPVQNIGINLTFADQAGNAVVASSNPDDTSASFFVRVDALSGIDAIDGSGTVGPKSTGEVHWLIIPAAGTGGIQPQGRLYFVGASLTYTLLGETTTVLVTPDFITVKPQPLLALDYFLAGDVYADDPFTAEVEPSEPFTLGLRIRNVGGGTAAKVAIESAQPKIVDNKQGLLVGFQILDSHVNDQPASKTLLINLGDLGPGASAVGRWNMVTTLSGRFVELVAGYTHADSLGGALTSLIQGIETHLLVRDVKSDLPGRDHVRDFLALDGDVLRLYESEGTDTVVTDQSANARLAATAGQHDLTFPPTAGYAYVKLTDPFAGRQPPGTVVRSDGKTLPAENAWLSKARNADLTWSYHLNVFDVDTTGSYRVSFGASALASIAGVVYVDANDSGMQDTGEDGLGATAVTLSGTDDQGASVSTTAFTAPDGSWSFQQRPGTYSLEVAPVAGHADGKHQAGTAGGTVAGNTIGGIVLAANAGATGYRFAKVPVTPPPASQADLALTMSASNLTAAVGGSVTFTLGIANLGPATATAARVIDTLPATLALQSAVATAGTYDAATGTWTVGALAAKASATLTLVVKVTSVAAPITHTATASSLVTDPDSANNSASITLNADAGTLDVVQGIPREARVLAFVGCPGTTIRIGPPCTRARASFLGDYLAGQGYDVRVVADVDSFVHAFRSGRYNTYWLSGNDALGTLVMREIREAVRRGDTLIFDGPGGDDTAPLEEATGVKASAASVGRDLPITIGGGPAVTTIGEDRELRVRGGVVRATFATPTADPAIVTRTFGNGHGVVTAFDLLGTLQVPASEGALRPLIEEALATRAPQVPASFVGMAYVPVTTAVENLAAEAIVEVTITLPADVTLADTQPAPTSVEGTDVTWRFALPANATRYLDLGVRVPLASAELALTTTVRKVHPDGALTYGIYDLAISVQGSDQFGPKLLSDLQSLAGSSRARDSALASLQEAQAAIAANELAGAFAPFVAASESLDMLGAPSALAYQLVVDKWLQETQHRWHLGLPACAATSPVLAAGTTFAAFDADEGFAVRGGGLGTRLGWAWSLGADRTRADTSAQQQFDWVSGATYGWRLTYDGLGRGTYTVTAADVPLFSRTYSGSQGLLRSGNMLELRVDALPQKREARIDATVESINGQAVAASLSATALVQPAASALYLYYPPMVSGFELAGTVRLAFESPEMRLGAPLTLTVTAGNAACWPAQR